MPTLSLLMPVFNESATVTRAINAALGASYPIDLELLIVDDGSTDRTPELLAEWESEGSVRVVTHPQNRGKGAALRTAIAHAEGDYVAIMDADLEYDPQDVAKLLVPLLEGDADAVFGKRGFDSNSSFNFWYVVANKAVTMAANVLFNSWLSDMMTCHKAMRTETIRALALTSRGFDIEPEITAKLLKRGCRIHEVPISYQARSREDGKKLTALDGFRVLRTLGIIRFSPGITSEALPAPVREPERAGSKPH